MTGRYVPRHALPFDRKQWLKRVEEAATHDVCGDAGQVWCLPSCREQWHGGMHARWWADEVACRLPHDSGCDA